MREFRLLFTARAIDNQGAAQNTGLGDAFAG